MSVRGSGSTGSRSWPCCSTRVPSRLGALWLPVRVRLSLPLPASQTMLSLRKLTKRKPSSTSWRLYWPRPLKGISPRSVIGEVSGWVVIWASRVATSLAIANWAVAAAMTSSRNTASVILSCPDPMGTAKLPPKSASRLRLPRKLGISAGTKGCANSIGTLAR